MSHYVTSVALPLAGIRAMQQRRANPTHSTFLPPERLRHYADQFNQHDRETVTNFIPNVARLRIGWPGTFHCSSVPTRSSKRFIISVGGLIGSILRRRPTVSLSPSFFPRSRGAENIIPSTVRLAIIFTKAVGFTTHRTLTTTPGFGSAKEASRGNTVFGLPTRSTLEALSRAILACPGSYCPISLRTIKLGKRTTSTPHTGPFWT